MKTKKEIEDCLKNVEKLWQEADRHRRGLLMINSTLHSYHVKKEIKSLTCQMTTFGVQIRLLDWILKGK